MGSVVKYQDTDGTAFGDENSGSSEDRCVKPLLDQIRNTPLVKDKKIALLELQSVVSRSYAGQMAFGAMGFQVILSILKEKHDDVEMVVVALETLVIALTNYAKEPANEVQPNLINSDLLSSKEDNISILLSLLSQEDFYVQYYTLQLLILTRANSPQKLLEAICSSSNGIKQLLNSLNSSEVIQNGALSLLTYAVGLKKLKKF